MSERIPDNKLDYAEHRRRQRQKAIAKAIGLALAIVVAVIGLILIASCGTERVNLDQEAPAVFRDLRECATRISGDSGVAQETLPHLVNGGIHIATPDSMRKIMKSDQVVEALTHTEIHGADTSVTIYLRAPLRDKLQHELANAFVHRHRIALLGSDTAKAQTSRFYQKPPTGCVEYCPSCTGAY